MYYIDILIDGWISTNPSICWCLIMVKTISTHELIHKCT